MKQTPSHICFRICKLASNEAMPVFFLFEHCLCFSVVSYLMCTITDYNKTVKKEIFECPEIILDPLGHHAASYRHSGDVVAWHNHIHDIIVVVPIFQ